MGFNSLNTTGYFYWNPELFRTFGKEFLGEEEPRDCFFQAAQLDRGDEGKIELECVEGCGRHDPSLLCWTESKYDEACAAFFNQDILVRADSLEQLAALFAPRNEEEEEEVCSYNHAETVADIFSLLNEEGFSK